jgi:hypothetical protein
MPSVLEEKKKTFLYPCGSIMTQTFQTFVLSDYRDCPRLEMCN